MEIEEKTTEQLVIEAETALISYGNTDIVNLIKDTFDESDVKFVAYGIILNFICKGNYIGLNMFYDVIKYVNKKFKERREAKEA